MSMFSCRNTNSLYVFGSIAEILEVKLPKCDMNRQLDKQCKHFTYFLPLISVSVCNSICLPCMLGG